VSARRQWILIGVAFIAICALIPLVPRFTGIDGQLVMSGGPMAENGRPAFDNRPVPHRTVLVLDAETQKVAASAVTDDFGRFSMRVDPGHYLLKAPGIPLPESSTGLGGVGGQPGSGPSPCAVGLFGHTNATLVIRVR